MLPPVLPLQVADPEQTLVTLLGDGLELLVQVEEPEHVLLPPEAPDELVVVEEVPLVPPVVPPQVADPEQTLEPGLVVQLDEPEQTLFADGPELMVVQFDEPEHTLLITYGRRTTSPGGSMPSSSMPPEAPEAWSEDCEPEPD